MRFIFLFVPSAVDLKRQLGPRVMPSTSVFCMFFFQAEDGIRDLVRSRGLGDVYKRQALSEFSKMAGKETKREYNHETHDEDLRARMWRESVSYTHLPLPTSDLV